MLAEALPRGQGGRILDPSATTAKVLADRECRICGGPAATGHHIIPRGGPHYGDDVVDNIGPVGGSGTTGCHGALEGSPGRDCLGRPISPREARERFGASLRPEEVAYVLSKLGPDAGRDYLRRKYHRDEGGSPE
jgi:hypothetical protein